MDFPRYIPLNGKNTTTIPLNGKILKYTTFRGIQPWDCCFQPIIGWETKSATFESGESVNSRCADCRLETGKCTGSQRPAARDRITLHTSEGMADSKEFKLSSSVGESTLASRAPAVDLSSCISLDDFQRQGKYVCVRCHCCCSNVLLYYSSSNPSAYRYPVT